MMYKKSLPERRKQNDIMIDAVKLIQQLGKVPKWKKAREGPWILD